MNRIIICNTILNTHTHTHKSEELVDRLFKLLNSVNLANSNTLRHNEREHDHYNYVFTIAIGALVVLRSTSSGQVWVRPQMIAQLYYLYYGHIQYSIYVSGHLESPYSSLLLN